MRLDVNAKTVAADRQYRSTAQIDTPIMAVTVGTMSLLYPQRKDRRDRLHNDAASAAPGVHGEKWEPAQPVIQAFRSDRQQMSAHASERNAAWMSARLS